MSTLRDVTTEDGFLNKPQVSCVIVPVVHPQSGNQVMVAGPPQDALVGRGGDDTKEGVP